MKLKIKHKILIGVLSILIVALSVMGIVSIQISANALLDKISDNTILLAESYADNINKDIQNFKRTIKNYASSITTAINEEDVLLDAKKLYPKIDKLIYTTRTGKVNKMVPYDEKIFEVDFSEKDYWKKVYNKTNYIKAKWEKAIAEWKDNYQSETITQGIDFSVIKDEFGSDTIVISVPAIVFYGESTPADLQGVLHAFIPTKNFFESLISVKIGETGSLFIADSSGKLIQYEDKSLILSGMISDIGNADILADIQKNMVALNTGIGFYEGSDKKYFVSFAPVYEEQWSVGVKGVLAEFIDEIYNLIIVILVILAISITVSIFITYLIVNKLIKPVSSLIKTIDEMKQGDFDVQAEVINEDEIGELAIAFNEFTGILKKMTIEIDKSSEKANDISSQLSASSEETTASLEEIRSNMHTIKEKINNLADMLKSSKGTIKEIDSFILELNELVDSQKSSVHKSFEQIKEMTETINLLTKESEDKYAFVKNISQTAEVSQTEMDKAIGNINRVTESTQLIMDLISVIDTIASQTNLLAMNAAIEAAHAGEAGKGFGVVADEIRKLAENTTENSKEIANSLKQVTQYIGISADSINSTNDVLKEMVNGIETISDSLKDTTNKISGINDSANHINNALEDLISLTANVKISSDKTGKELKGISVSMSDVQEISDEINHSIEEISYGVEDLYNMAENVSDLSVKNNDNLQELESTMKKFTSKRLENITEATNTTTKGLAPKELSE